MANDCFYVMKIVGKEESVKEFVKVIQGAEDRCLSRIFDADAEDITPLSNGKYCTYINGSCAWSTYSCMLEGNLSYYNSRVAEGDEKATSLLKETKDLELKLELFSEESGVGFQEHYIINNGEVVVEDIVDYSEYYFDDFGDELTQDDVDRLNEEDGTDFKLDEYDEDRMSFVRGGFESWEYTI